MSSPSMSCSTVAARACTLRHIAHHPWQQIDGVHRLIDQCPAAIERHRLAPFRVAVIFRRAIPLYTRIGQQRLTNYCALHPLLQPLYLRLEAVLEHDSEFHVVLLRRNNQLVSAAVEMSIGFSVITGHPRFAAAMPCSA